MRRTHASDWMEIATAAAQLGLDSAGVIAMRSAGVAFGGAGAADEVWRMWSEKVVALAEWQARLCSGSLGRTPQSMARETLKHYRGKVAANRRRLVRGAR